MNMNMLFNKKAMEAKLLVALILIGATILFLVIYIAFLALAGSEISQGIFRFLRSG